MAVTNNPASALAQAAEFSVDVRAGVERAVAATKTYTAELLALYLLLMPLADGRPDTRQLADQAAAVAEAARAQPRPAGRVRAAAERATGSPTGCSPPRAATAIRPRGRRR